MLEQLNGLLNTTAIEEGVEAGLEYADSFGPWGRTAAVGITLGVTAATTLLMMNQCRARSASKDLSKKSESPKLESTTQTLVLSDDVKPLDDTAGKVLPSASSSLSDSDSESDHESDKSNRSRSRSRSSSPRK
ncbi:hypothetical protein CC99x_007105 [Candidatus Berkiella cookevillensis]|uniref:Uncharacterized protein n=1 Tax=Candidatus Berkiella cookevillensis TaxID=437022 RepID=A0A0Q9YCE6_9GAMM|nr:hypothetical protein [Candidatus Berkiella cookevillensis]MCS5708674.1 hypothetical protein [Candidatus Berkiella cookevillensis]